MKAVIYGKPVCPWCDRAKALAEAKGVEFEYVDITAAGIDGAKLSEIMGRPVRTVPQIQLDGDYIGGFEDFKKVLDARFEVEDPSMNYFIRERGEGDWVSSTFEQYERAKSQYEMDSKKEPK